MRVCNRRSIPPPRALAGRSPDELAELFERADAPDPPLDGRYRGGLIATTFAPGLDVLLGSAFERTRPWLGKRFDAAAGGGQNVLDRRLWGAGRLLTPHRYRAWWPEDDDDVPGVPVRDLGRPVAARLRPTACCRSTTTWI